MSEAVSVFIRDSDRNVPDALTRFLNSVGGVPNLIVTVISLSNGPPGPLLHALEIIFDSKDGFELLTSESILPILVSGLFHPEESVRELLLTLLQRWKNRQAFLLSSPFYDRILRCVRDPSLGVAHEAISLLTHLGTTNREGLQRLFSESSRAILFPSSSSSSAVERDLLCDLRGLDLSIKVAVSGQESWQAFKEAGLLDFWVSLLSQEELLADPLMLLNHLECGQQLLESRLGFNDVLKGQFLQRIIALATEENKIIFCGILSFVETFANIAHELRWEAWSEVRVIYSLLENCLNEDDTVLQRASINTIGTIGCSQAGLSLVHPLLQQLPRFLWLCDEELQIATLRALAAVLANGEEATDHILQAVWTSISVSAVRTHGDMSSAALIYRLARLPFDDISTGAFQLLLGLAHRSWGTSVLANEPGFLEFLVDPQNPRQRPLRVEIAKRIEALPGLDPLMYQRLQEMSSTSGYVTFHASPMTEGA